MSASRPGAPARPAADARQRFFRLGEVILEVGRGRPAGDGPAAFWGLALTVDDIDATAAHLAGRPQANRRRRSRPTGASPRSAPGNDVPRCRSP